jgi:hypothetical protein
MTRKSYEAFLTGHFKSRGLVTTQVRFTDAWVFDSNVQPLFPVPSCVLFAEPATGTPALPTAVEVFSGHLPRRDAHRDEADEWLTLRASAWPTGAASQSEYAAAFHAGAKLDPRRLILVERVPAGRLGENPAAPLVRGRTGTLDKKPWKQLTPPEGAVEAEFLRPVYLGESIGPFVAFDPVLAVIPWSEHNRALLTSDSAAKEGFSLLSAWLGTCEALWTKHGKGRTSFREKLDFYHLLTTQFPIRGPRVVYSKSGTNPAAAIITDDRAVIDHKLYWSTIATEDEAHYLVAIFNSETARSRVEHWQSQGSVGCEGLRQSRVQSADPQIRRKTQPRYRSRGNV